MLRSLVRKVGRGRPVVHDVGEHRRGPGGPGPSVCLAVGAAAERAREMDAVCAVGRTAARPGQISLSPASILAAPPPERLVLPSPNGSAICEALADEGPTVVAVARTAFRAVSADLPVHLAACASGVELIVKGFAADVAIAGGLDVSAVVPVLADGWFAPVE